MLNGKSCIVCAEPLTGRQRLFCSARCRKRGQRHPDKYPKPDKPQLAVVTAQKPPMKTVGRISAAVNAGKREEILDALLQRLAVEIDVSDDARIIAPLAGRMLDIIDRTQPENNENKKGGLLDELTARRARRAEAR